jgi:hypothetical protein
MTGESEAMTLEDWVEKYAQDCLEHALTVHDARDTFEIFKAGLREAHRAGALQMRERAATEAREMAFDDGIAVYRVILALPLEKP